MKFILRFLTVSAVAVVFGVVLYYAVQAWPNDSRAAVPSTSVSPTQSVLSTPASQASRPERADPTRKAIQWRSIVRVGRHVLQFSLIVLATVLTRSFVFGRKPNSKNS